VVPVALTAGRDDQRSAGAGQTRCYRRPAMSALDLPDDFQTAPLAEVDPDIARVLQRELERQQGTLEMIASENFVPQAVLDATGSVLTNKYAEGYPGRRYYGGCEEVDVAEQLAIDRAKELFGAEHANVQPHAGAQANNATYMALLDPGDTIMGMALDHGGHLTHGMKLNVSGKLYEVVAYHVRRQDLRCDMDEVARLAEEHRPKLIMAGWSAYPRHLDFAAFREVADSVGARLVVDMAHFAGLVAAGEHPSPIPHADVVTTTIHKTLCGPRSGMILCREELAKDIDRSVFPGEQGGPLMHVIAAKAVALGIAQSEPFRARQRQTVSNAKALADALIAGGIEVLTGGTDVHLVLVDLTSTGLDGKTAETRLEEVGITVNRNAIPFDERPPMNPSGLRIGSPALTTRGLGEEDMREIAEVISIALSGRFDSERDALLDRSRTLMDRYPLYPQLSAAAV
jgi:glycine hydroxymethyltransferase